MEKRNQWPEDTQLEVGELRLDPKCACAQSHRAHPQSVPAELGGKHHIGGWGEDLLKEGVFEFSCSGWVCFYRYGLTEHGPAGKGRKVSKGVDTRHGDMNSISEGTVNK